MYGKDQQEGLNCSVEVDRLCLTAVQSDGVKRQIIIMKGDRKMCPPTVGAEAPFPFGCLMLTQNTSYQLNLISNLRSCKQRPIFKNCSAAAVPFLASQKWKAIVAHLSLIRAVQV